MSKRGRAGAAGAKYGWNGEKIPRARALLHRCPVGLVLAYIAFFHCLRLRRCRENRLRLMSLAAWRGRRADAINESIGVDGIHFRSRLMNNTTVGRNKHRILRRFT